MSAALVRALQARLKRLEANALHYRQGVVTSTSPLAITLGDSPDPYTDVKKLDTYTPAVDDVVAVLRWGRDLIVLGEVT